MKNPDNKRSIIPSCPDSGCGVHIWIMKAAWACRSAGMTEGQAMHEIKNGITRIPNPTNEIDSAVEKVFARMHIIGDRSRGQTRCEKWPTKNPLRIEAISESGYGIEDLKQESPFSLNSKKPRTTEILELLFPGNPWLCTGSIYRFSTERLSKIKRPEMIQQIVPNPMTAKIGITQDGKESEHTLINTGARRFLVIEGDGTPKDTQAAVLRHLAKTAPLTLVCDSGGKSLHGWFFVHGISNELLLPFFRQAISLGADPILWGRSQFVRMPDGLRENGNRQHIFFLTLRIYDTRNYI